MVSSLLLVRNNCRSLYNYSRLLLSPIVPNGGTGTRATAVVRVLATTANTTITSSAPTPAVTNTNTNANDTTTAAQVSQTEGAGFRQNCSEYVQMDNKVFFAAADRNKDVILDQLRPYLDTARQVLEVGSGSGQHTYHFSKAYPNVTFQPTEYDTALLASIDAYASDLLKEGHLIHPALELDATNSIHWKHVLQAGQEQGQEEEEQPCYDVVMTTNVFHISPWVVGQSIVRGAGRVLKPGGRFLVYGPFKRHGAFNTESNREFDKTLRGKDASWGVRDIEEIQAVAASPDVHLKLDQIVDMPSNNYILSFTKQ